jgi:hypothetical protein
MATSAALHNNLSELDAMLQDLNRTSQAAKKTSGSSSAYGGDYSDYFPNSSVASSTPQAPSRPPPPKSYVPDAAPDRKRKDHGTTSAASTLRLPNPRKPPKLMHVLNSKKSHELVKSGPRLDDVMKAPDFPEDEDYGDGSNYSTLSRQPEPDIHLPELSDDELENLDAGETPRGDKSMIIKTDYGELKSKYHYLGFGLWENTEPAEPPPPPRKPSPPPPPPKAEPIWYNCTVSVATHKSSKELDDLFHDLDGYDRFPKQNVEIGNEGGNLPGHLGDLYEEFDKEDMSEMFRRAFLEKMGLMDDGNRTKYRCHVCHDWIRGRVITAMAHKFHPECFVCTYCRKEFKDRQFKSDDEYKPYCYECFEKLLGHFGTAHKHNSQG